MIKVENLTKKFDDVVAINNISFEIKKGEVFAFLGPNGAGKSTTIKILTTLLRQTSGNVWLNGFNNLENPKEVRSSIGVIFQDPSLDDELTAWENLEFHGVLYKMGKKIRRERIEKLMKFVELWERKDDLVKEFSGGMKRRLEIARGLLHHPKILFLDEPTLGLDPQTRNHMWNYLQKLNQEEKTTIFFSTHYLEEAEKIAQQIAIVDHGNVIAKGSVKELKEQIGKDSLEEVFLTLTGKDIRKENGQTSDRMRMFFKNKIRR